jgi:hypothetical protein
MLIKENTLPSGSYPTESGSARVPRVGEWVACRRTPNVICLDIMGHGHGLGFCVRDPVAI